MTRALPALRRLRVWTNDYDTVVAESAEEARDIDCAAIGEKPSDYDADDWHTLDDSASLLIWSDVGATECGCGARREAENEASLQPIRDAEKLRELLRKQGATYIHVETPRVKPLTGWLPNGHHESCAIGSKRQTCAEWIAENGKGFLCSTEY